ncbi:MAG: PilN domain-containing protein, partial [Acidobacteriota bacterium]
KQQGPVYIMDQISRALPDLLWLESMRMVGETITIKGKAFNTNAIATFIGNLNRIPEFREPDTKDVSADRNSSNLYSFSIVFNFIPPSIEPEEGEEGAAAPNVANAA